MAGKEVLTIKERAELCTQQSCEEHNDGQNACLIPLYKEDLQQALKTPEVSLQDTETKTATGIVEYSDER